MEENTLIEEAIDNLLVTYKKITRPGWWSDHLDLDLARNLQMVFTYYVGSNIVVRPRFVKVGEFFDRVAEEPPQDAHANEAFKDAADLVPSDGSRTLDVRLDGLLLEEDLLWAGLGELTRMYQKKQSPPVGTAVLRLYDRLGNFLEEWKMCEVVPTHIHIEDRNIEEWNEVDVTLSLKYKYHTFRCGVNAAG